MSTSLGIQKLGIGTVQFGLKYGVANQYGITSDQDALDIVKLARNSGIDLLDTAISYGQSERRLGTIGVDDFSVVTKLPPLPDTAIDVDEWVENHVKGSIKCLGVGSLYGLLLHQSKDLLGHNGNRLVDALEQIKARKLVKKIGISVYSPKDLDTLMDLMHIDLVQAPFSVVDRRLETSGWLARLKASNVELHVRSVFLQGLLLMPRDSIPHKFKKWAGVWDKWYSELERLNVTPSRACLGYPMSKSEISRIIIGCQTAGELKMLLSDMAQLSSDDWSFMASEDPLLINPSKWTELQ